MKETIYKVKQTGIPEQKVTGKNLKNWAKSYYSDNKSYFKSINKKYPSNVFKSIKKSIDFLEKEYDWKISKIK
ncbi:hypothetical protein EOM09_04980 [bacterium]|nr:hypothetical protein [bacterium]